MQQITDRNPRGRTNPLNLQGKYAILSFRPYSIFVLQQNEDKFKSKSGISCNVQYDCANFYRI